MDETSPKRGRPQKPESERYSDRIEVRVTPEQRRKLDQLGGANWIRGKLDKARLPKSL